jgi:hypothetical protein
MIRPAPTARRSLQIKSIPDDSSGAEEGKPSPKFFYVRDPRITARNPPPKLKCQVDRAGFHVAPLDEQGAETARRQRRSLVSKPEILLRIFQ